MRYKDFDGIRERRVGHSLNTDKLETATTGERAFLEAILSDHRDGRIVVAITYHTDTAYARRPYKGCTDIDVDRTQDFFYKQRLFQ